MWPAWYAWFNSPYRRRSTQSNVLAQEVLPIIVHPTPIPVGKLPAHCCLPSVQGTDKPGLQSFLQDALDEGLDILETRVPPKDVPAREYPSKGSKSKVKLTHEIRNSQAIHFKVGWQGPVVRPWYTRCSVHDDCSEEGTANYREFVSFIKKNHATNTYKRDTNHFDPPSIKVEWDCRDLRFDNGWRNVTARVNVINEFHYFGPSRIYMILEITAARCIYDPNIELERNGAIPTETAETEANYHLQAYEMVPPSQTALIADPDEEVDGNTRRESFIIVQLPVEHEEIIPSLLPLRHVFKSFVSVEHVAQIGRPPGPDGEEPTKPQIEWKRVISPNAGQLLGTFYNRNWHFGLPRILVSDVGRFFADAAQKRRVRGRARTYSPPRRARRTIVTTTELLRPR